MAGPVASNNAGEQDVVIRFPQVDPAGIVFYPRYFEMVTRLFPEIPFLNFPAGIKTQFLKPNRLGDSMQLSVNDQGGEHAWSVTGRMEGVDYFSMAPIDPGSPALPDSPAFQSSDTDVGRWCVGGDGRMQLSRYFEVLNMAIEEWFESTLDMPFAELHVDRRVGIPTVQFDTKVFSMPALAERVSLWISPNKVGGRSLTFTSWLKSDEVCHVENTQVVVFVRMREDGYESIEIPDYVRSAMEQQVN